MNKLEERILKNGIVKEPNILKVDSFINHQIDVGLLNDIGKMFKERFDEEITKILTIEASGIAIATVAAQYFNVPVVFAKKVESKNLNKDVYETKVYSFTKDREYTVKVSKDYLNSSDKILVIDDFLANGHAAMGLIDLVNQSGADMVGVGIVIEKGFQEGGKLLRDKGIKVESIAIVDSMESGTIKFRGV